MKEIRLSDEKAEEVRRDILEYLELKTEFRHARNPYEEEVIAKDIALQAAILAEHLRAFMFWAYDARETT